MNMTRKLRRGHQVRLRRGAVGAVGVGMVLSGGLTIPTPLGDAVADAQVVGSAPVLMTGTLRNQAGQPVAGTIGVSVRPVGNALASTPMLQLSTVSAGSDGQFEIRLPYTASLDAYRDQDGVIAFVTQTLVDGEVGIGINELKYLADERAWVPGGRASAYEAAKASMLAKGANLSAYLATAEGQGLLEPMATEMSTLEPTENPSNFTGGSPVKSQFQLATNATGGLAAYGDPLQPGRPCELWSTGYLMDSPMLVSGQLSERAAYWKQVVVYKRSGTTQSEVKFTAAGSGVWSISGWSTMGNSHTASAESPLDSSANERRGRKYGITASNKVYEWKCWDHDTPPPINIGYWRSYLSVEKEGWIKDWIGHDVSNVVPNCDENPNNMHGVDHGSTVSRTSSASHGIGVAGSVTFPGSGHFSFGVETSVSNTWTEEVTWRWENLVPSYNVGKKYVCGVGGNPWGDRRVIPVAQGWND